MRERGPEDPGERREDRRPQREKREPEAAGERRRRTSGKGVNEERER